MSFLLFIITVILPGFLLTAVITRQVSIEWTREYNWLVPFLSVPGGFLIVSIIMEILEYFHMLSFRNVIILSGIVSALQIVYLFSRGSFLGIFKILKPESKIKTAIAASGLLLYLSLTIYPFSFIFDTTDCGIYVASGIHAFKEGSFRFIDEEIRDSDERFKQVFVNQLPPEQCEAARCFHFEGQIGQTLLIRDLDTGLIEPRYFNLHPFWIGLFVKIFGLEPGVWLATPFVALAGMIGLLTLATALSGWSGSLLSLFLMAVFVLQVWLGRYITTEMAVQASLLNGLAWFAVFRKTNEWKAMFVSGLFIGLSHFARIDTVLVIPAMLATFFIWACFEDKLQRARWFILGYLMMLEPAILMASQRFHSYTLETLRHVNFDNLSSQKILLGLIFMGLIVVSIVPFRRYRVEILTFLTKNQYLLWILFFSISGVGLIYGYAIRPAINPPDYEAFWAMDQTMRSYALNQMTLQWQAWYLTLPGLIIAFIGIGLLMKRTVTVTLVPIWFTFLIYAFYFFHKIHCTPYHYWGMRRYMTVVIPFLILGIGSAFSGLLQWCNQKGKKKLIFAGFMGYLILAGYFIYDLRVIIRHNNWDGAISLLQDISDKLTHENDRLIMPGYPGIYMHVPLKLVFDKNAYIYNNHASKEVMDSIIKQWQSAGDRVFFMSQTQLNHQAQDNTYQFQEVMHSKPMFPLLRDTVESKPEAISYHSFEFWIYELIN